MLTALDFLFLSEYVSAHSTFNREVTMKPKNLHSELELLLSLVEESYVRKAWHGPNLRGSLRGLTAKEAAWRPSPHRHNIWEIMVHCSYWKYIVRRRILGEKKGSFAIKGSNWFNRPVALTSEAFRQDLALLEEIHESMVDAISSLLPSELKEIPKNSKVSTEAIIRGIASHDVYHAGQIQLLKRLMK